MLHEQINLWASGEGCAKLDIYVPYDPLAENSAKSRPNKCVLVLPGGGYEFCSPREAEPVALAFASKGFSAFVLWYTVESTAGRKGLHPQPLLDASKAVCLIRENASKWRVDPENIAVCGFSAGGHLAASLGVFWDEAYIKEALGIKGGENRPDKIILSYAVLNGLPGVRHDGSFENLLGAGRESDYLKLSPADNVNEKTPPAFIWHIADDACVKVENALLFASKLSANKIPFEMHIYESGQHGMSIADEIVGTPDCHVKSWLELCINWLNKSF